MRQASPKTGNSPSTEPFPARTALYGQGVGNDANLIKQSGRYRSTNNPIFIPAGF
jgi:hypothetical protein